MARQVLPIVGAVIGAWVTGGSPQGAQWGYMIGSADGPAVDPVAPRLIGAIFGGEQGAKPVYTMEEAADEFAECMGEP